MKKIIFCVFLSISLKLIFNQHSHSFLPPHDLKISVQEGFNSGLSESQFEEVIDSMNTIYAPLVREKGGRLQINKKWKSSIVNASTSRLGKIWYVNMYGGFARHPLMTPDAFALILCHEIGHHLGGAPRLGVISRGGFFGTWSSVEGQADYFGTLKCLRRYFSQNDWTPKESIPPIVQEKCEAHRPQEVPLCLRSSMAGLEVTRVLASLRKVPIPQFETPDEKEVDDTSYEHPTPQCRLDTFFQGALCDVSLNEELSRKDEAQGACHRSNGDHVGLRPRCWYK